MHMKFDFFIATISLWRWLVPCLLIALDKEQLGQDKVPDYLAISFSSTDYIGHLFGASSLESEDNIAHLDRTLANLFTYVDKKIGLANYHPKRSGDIYLVFEPNVFINNFDDLIVASTHDSPWRYDTFVPVTFAGAGLSAKKVSRPITPYDITPTLAAYLNTKPPSSAIGTPLPEV